MKTILSNNILVLIPLASLVEESTFTASRLKSVDMDLMCARCRTIWCLIVLLVIFCQVTTQGSFYFIQF